jgi:hypothetical protein
MLESPILKFAISTTLLQRRGIDSKKALAAGAAAAVIPGTLGLVVPLVLVGQTGTLGQSTGGLLSEVPDVVGSPRNDAERALKGLNLKPDSQTHQIASNQTYGEGIVVQQKPPAKTLVKPGTTVQLIVSAGCVEDGKGVKRIECPAAA